MTNVARKPTGAVRTVPTRSARILVVADEDIFWTWMELTVMTWTNVKRRKIIVPRTATILLVHIFAVVALGIA